MLGVKKQGLCYGSVEGDPDEDSFYLNGGRDLCCSIAAQSMSHRCVECRSCPECKRGERLDSVSIQEEVEQSLIDRSVKVDVDSSTTTAMLPFLVDPDVRLISNERQALSLSKSSKKV